MIKTLYVGVKETGFRTIQEALDYSLNIDPLYKVNVFILEGDYYERIRIDRDKVSLIGLGSVRIISSTGAYELDENEEPIGTFKTATCYVNGNYIFIKNVEIINQAGQGYKVGQAVSLHINGSYVVVENTTLRAFQDTLFIAPLPPRIVNGEDVNEYIGNKRTHSQVYFNTCYIEGTIDFIFGGGSAYFNQCQIHSLKQDRDIEVDSYITAASTDREFPIGLVMNECIFTSQRKVVAYLGRPWREYGHTIIQNSWLGSHILPQGWEVWSNKDALEHTRYFEFNNTSSVTPQRVAWAKYLQQEIKIEEVFDTYQLNFIEECYGKN